MFPSPPGFPVTFPRTKQTMRSEMESLALLSAEMSAREYIPNKSAQQPYLLRYRWTAQAGYADHCVGRLEQSPRPFLPGDCCDGTRDAAALYLARAACWQVGYGEKDWNDLMMLAYQGPPPDFVYLVWFSKCWRDHEIGQEYPFTSARYSALLHSLYAMNYRKLHAVLEGLMPRFLP